MVSATHLDVDIEANILRLLALTGISTDASKQHEIADEDVVCRGVILTARFRQSVLGDEALYN